VDVYVIFGLRLFVHGNYMQAATQAKHHTTHKLFSWLKTKGCDSTSAWYGKARGEKV
jgi:hypothetical protein